MSNKSGMLLLPYEAVTSIRFTNQIYGKLTEQDNMKHQGKRPKAVYQINQSLGCHLNSVRRHQNLVKQ